MYDVTAYLEVGTCAEQQFYEKETSKTKKLLSKPKRDSVSNRPDCPRSRWLCLPDAFLNLTVRRVREVWNVVAQHGG